MLRKSSLFIVGMFMVFVVGLLNFNMAFAVSETYISDQDIIRQKVFYTGVITCYQADEKEGGLIGSISVSDFYGDASSLIPYAAAIMNPVKDISYRNDGKSILGCKPLLTEKTAKKLPTDVVASITEREERLKNAKYSSSSNAQVDNSEKKYCYSYAYKEEEEYENYIDPEMSTRDKKERFTPRLCLRREEGGGYVAFKEDIGGQSEDYIKFGKLGTSKLELKVKVDDTEEFRPIFFPDYKFVTREYDLSDWSIENESKFFAQVGNDIAKFMGSTSASSNLHNVESNETGKSTSVFYAACDKFEYYSDNSGIKCTTDDKYSARWDEQGKDSVIYTKMALGNLNDYRNYDNYNELVEYYSDGKFNYRTIKFEDDEIYRLYTFYLSNFYRVNSKNILCYDDTRNGAGDRRARLWWEEEGKYSEYCYFTVEDKYANEKVNGVDERKYFGKEIGLDELIATLNNLNLEDKPKEQDSGGNSSVCYDSSGGLSWILCPIISGASGIGAHMWDRIENYHLKIPAQEVFEPGGGVQQAWGVVRDVANSAFIVLLLFVIFSQLTGVGIDNYGIKKILPKLIIVAVLVNLSYLICQLAVDLSNLLGIGLNSLLSGFANNLDNIEITASSATVGGGAMDVVLGLGGVGLYGLLAGGTTMGSAFILGGAAIGLMVLGVVITVVAAMVVLYLILVVREAGIILAIVVAPVAIVCYMLPNTEKIYKKWFGLFKGLLFVYPICGAMVGAGRLAGVTLASIDSGSMKVAAMIVQVLPFFFIPMLLKSSLALMGNVGAKISTFGRGLGRKVSSTTQGAIKGSERFKDMEQFNKEKGLLKRANRIISKYNGKEGLSDRQLLRLRKANNVVSGRQEDLYRGRNLAMGGLEAERIALEKKADKDAIANEMVLIRNATNDGADGEAVARIFDEAMKEKNYLKARAAIQVAGRRKDTAVGFMNETLTNRTKEYSEDALKAIAKEISEGETSANYRAGSSLAFEYASQLNKGKTGGSYASWVDNKKNIHEALNNHIGTSSQLTGAQNSSLMEIASLMSNGKVDDYDINRIRNLAKEAIEFNKEKGVELDSTKAFNIYRLAYGDGQALGNALRGANIAVSRSDYEKYLRSGGSPITNIDELFR